MMNNRTENIKTRADCGSSKVSWDMSVFILSKGSVIELIISRQRLTPIFCHESFLRLSGMCRRNLPICSYGRIPGI
jgi:hypothetical protein